MGFGPDATERREFECEIGIGIGIDSDTDPDEDAEHSIEAPGGILRWNPG